MNIEDMLKLNKSYPTEDAEKSGFFPLKDAMPGCADPSHNFPTHIAIPAGQGYRHVCPSCRKVSTSLGSRITM